METAIARLGDLLAKAGVQYRIESLSISSIRTPVVLLSFQRALYGNRNRVGLNPFPFITGVNVRCQPDKRGLTRVIVEVNSASAFLYVVCQVCVCGLGSVGMPTPGDAILFIAVTLPPFGLA